MQLPAISIKSGASCAFLWEKTQKATGHDRSPGVAHYVVSRTQAPRLTETRPEGGKQVCGGFSRRLRPSTRPRRPQTNVANRSIPRKEDRTLDAPPHAMAPAGRMPGCLSFFAIPLTTSSRAIRGGTSERESIQGICEVIP